jgi:hypothetical protein
MVLPTLASYVYGKAAINECATSTIWASEQIK